MKLNFKVLTFIVTAISLIALLQVSQIGIATIFPSGGQGSP